MATVPLAHTLKPRNSVFPRMWLVPPNVLSHSQSPGWATVRVSESVRRPLKGCLGFQQPLISPRLLESPLIFHSHILCGFPFPALEPWAGEFQRGTGTHPFSKEKLCGWYFSPSAQLGEVYCIFLCLWAYFMEISLSFWVAPFTSLSMATSLLSLL